MKRAHSLYSKTPRQFKAERADCAVRAVAVAVGVGYWKYHNSELRRIV